MLEGLELTAIHDIEGPRQAIIQLLNLVETLAADNRELRVENPRLRDELNRLKGEQGRPKIKPDRPAPRRATRPTRQPQPGLRPRHSRRELFEFWLGVILDRAVAGEEENRIAEDLIGLKSR